MKTELTPGKLMVDSYDTIITINIRLMLLNILLDGF